MQRMADVLTSMMNRSSQSVDSPMSPVGSPMPEPSFPANNSSTLSPNSFVVPDPSTGNSEEIDCVTYESLGRSENQSDNVDIATGSSSDAGRRLESTFSSFRIRQDSEQSVAGNSVQRFTCSKILIISLLTFHNFIYRELSECDELAYNSTLCDMNEEYQEPLSSDFLYQPDAKVKFVGHRNTRYTVHFLLSFALLLELPNKFIFLIEL